MTHEQSKSEINKSLAKPLVSTAGILGLIQGIAWTVFSVLCICCYCDIIQVDISNGTTVEYYKLIYYIFLNEDGSENISQDMLVKPRDFLIFMCFYLAFSVIWTLLSGTAIWAMIHDQWHLGKSLFGAWSTITILISIVDVVLTSLLAGDYITVNNNSDKETEFLVSYGIVMSLAARGYILWVVNIIFAGILMKYTVSIIMKENKNSTMPVIHGYESNDVNPPWFNGSVKDFWSNPPPITSQTSNVYENQGFERSQSFSPLQSPENFYSAPPTRNYNPHSTNNNQNASANTENNPTSFSEAIRTATIGRNKGKRSPVNRVAPPLIPDPDYTPPSSPNGLKSVLRSRSNYYL